MENSSKQRWNRVEEILRKENLSICAFAHWIGLARAEELYRIKRGEAEFSQALAERIHAKYPAYSEEWL